VQKLKDTGRWNASEALKESKMYRWTPHKQALALTLP